ncbi:hypothetical protein [Rufibacter ruber]|uniref:hypothetical protein n=1 Tax=Rufibacter ruber TaxID=1783499 RepID=UPI00082B2331|nr:hypothetical protein [Rufibacter ruber]
MATKFSRIKKVTRGKGQGGVFTAEQLEKELNEPLAEAARMIKEYIIAEAEKGGRHKFRKDGSSSFVTRTEVEFTTDGVRIDLPEQAQYLETGRRPFAKKVPIQALIKWLKRYRIGGRDQKTGRFRKVSSKSINDAAWAIQQSIFRNGIKARPFIQASLEYAEKLISEVIEEQLIPDILSIVDFHFNDKK